LHGNLRFSSAKGDGGACRRSLGFASAVLILGRVGPLGRPIGIGNSLGGPGSPALPRQASIKMTIAGFASIAVEFTVLMLYQAVERRRGGGLERENSPVSHKTRRLGEWQPARVLPQTGPRFQNEFSCPRRREHDFPGPCCLAQLDLIGGGLAPTPGPGYHAGHAAAAARNLLSPVPSVLMVKSSEVAGSAINSCSACFAQVHPLPLSPADSILL
jgi:hypothetical protein